MKYEITTPDGVEVVEMPPSSIHLRTTHCLTVGSAGELYCEEIMFLPYPMENIHTPKRELATYALGAWLTFKAVEEEPK